MRAARGRAFVPPPAKATSTMQVFLAKLVSMVTGKKDGDREAELEAALEAIRMASMEAGNVEALSRDGSRMRSGGTSKAGQRLDLKCTLVKTTSPENRFAGIDRVLIDTNNPPRVELFNSSTMGNTSPHHWVFAEGNECGDRLIIFEPGNGTIIGSALRGLHPNNFLWRDGQLTWAYLSPDVDDVFWFRWKCSQL